MDPIVHRDISMDFENLIKLSFVNFHNDSDSESKSLKIMNR